MGCFDSPDTRNGKISLNEFHLSGFGVNRPLAILADAESGKLTAFHKKLTPLLGMCVCSTRKGVVNAPQSQSPRSPDIDLN
jgi:hypothetical protein